jgi:hypothetical protein
VSDAALDAAELEAIQAAIRGSVPRGGGSNAAEEVEATHLALIADDRVAQAARPVLSGVIGKWAKDAQRVLASHIPGQWRLEVVGGEVIDGPTAKEEMRGGWTCALKGGDLELALVVHGNAIDAAVSQRCGGPIASIGRAPSLMMLRLFKPAGQAIAASIGNKLTELLDRPIQETSDTAVIDRIIEARGVVRVAAVFGGDLGGQINIYARPETLVAPAAILPAARAEQAVIANAMANVPVEVVVELGTVQLPLSALRNLDPTITHALPGFVDSRIPLFCGGALKAWVRPVVTRGVLAVEIVAIVHDQGTTT